MITVTVSRFRKSNTGSKATSHHLSSCQNAMMASPNVRGPKGEKRPVDAIGVAILVGKIATGEVAESSNSSREAPVAELGWLGGKARAKELKPEKRPQIAKKVAAER
jgi:hypothetical protein